MAHPPLTVAVPVSTPLRNPAPADGQTEGAPCIPSPCLSDLSDGEHLIVWMFRRIAVARVWCPVIDYELGRLLSRHQGDIRDALQRFLAHLAHHGRRKLRVGMPGFPVLTADEQLLIAVMAAAQTQEIARLRALLPWLLGRADTGNLLPLVTVIGAGFALNGLHVRRPPETVAQ